VSVPEDVLALPLAAQIAWADTWLEHRLTDKGLLSSPRDLSPLPMLGIPGVVRENAVREFYEDTTQFRPLGARSPAAVISDVEATSLAL
jgi:hypothetical protein